MKVSTILAVLIFTTMSCQTPQHTSDLPSGLTISSALHGPTPDGDAMLYTLANQHGTRILISTYGGIITQLWTSDRMGKMADIVLGFDSLKSYQDKHPYFGALIGRYANRIAKGSFNLDEATYQLPINNGQNALHGGRSGFDKKLWKAETRQSNDQVSLILRRRSSHLEEGYPGNLDVVATYTLDSDNQLTITYEAVTDQPTIINLTNHCYYNLKGAGQGDILDHEVSIAADSITEIDDSLIPTGRYLPIEGTAFDFMESRRIGESIDDTTNNQVRFGGGYDHNFVLREREDSLALAATVYEPTSGRTLQVLTTEPGLQFYCGNFLDGSLVGKGGLRYQKRFGFCLETQHFPDSPNQPNFPSTRLDPGDAYASTTVYRFGVR
ncbi:MAG: aldose epimerase family protein [Bacteroidota bacterium]